MIDLFFYFLPAILGGAASGLVCGFLPFILAKNRRRPWLGMFALFATVASGIVLGLILALPIAASFSTAILLAKEGSPKPIPTPQPAFSESTEVETLV
ncbi:MAG: hypothetical protein AAGL08_12495 [Cyanobacteria bacterium J06573_11]